MTPQERYVAAAHAMQSGVAMDMTTDPNQKSQGATTPKHHLDARAAQRGDRPAVPQFAAQPSLRARVMQIADRLRHDADGIEADPHLSPLTRHADAEARRTAAARLDMRSRSRCAPCGGWPARQGRHARTRSARRSPRASGSSGRRWTVNDAAPRPLTAPDVAAGLLADVAEARAENAELTAQLALDMGNWPKCPDGCGCRLGLGDADRQEGAR